MLSGGSGKWVDFLCLLTSDSIVNMGEGVSLPNLAGSGQSLKNKYSSDPSIFPHIIGVRTNAFPPSFLRDCYMMSCDLLLLKKPPKVNKTTFTHKEAQYLSCLTLFVQWR